MKNNGEKILIIDDSQENIEILYEVLHSEYRIFYAKDGKSGLDLISIINPDIILLDIIMPEMDGYQVLEKLKKNPETNKIPVLFISALSQDIDEEKGLRLGAIDYIGNPINPHIVKARIKNHLELKKYRDYLEYSVLQEQTKYRELIDNIDSVVWESNCKTYEISFMSKQCETIFGYPAKSFYENSNLIKEIIAKDDWDKFEAIILKMDIKNRHSETEMKVIAKSGEIKWVKNVFSLSFDAGEIKKINGIMVDITKAKHYEEELKRAMEKAESANRAKSNFLSNISHEVRTPLNGIYGAAQILKMEKHDSDAESILEDLFVSVERLENLMSRIIRLTEIESESSVKEETKFNLKRTINLIWRDFAQKAEKKGLIFNFEEKATNCFVLGDEKKIKIVLKSIVENAVKFTDIGEVTLYVELNSGEMTAVVKDTGIGISREYMDKIYDMFQQEDYSSTRRFEGIGIGLFLSKKIVDTLGGKIEIKSDKDVGTEVRIIIPIRMDL